MALAALDRVAVGLDDLVLATAGDRPVGLGFLRAGTGRLLGHVGTVERLMRAPSLHGSGVGAAVLRGP